MRHVLFAALIALGACGEAAVESPAAGPETAHGYTLEVFASDAEQVYLVSHESGREAAARAFNEVSETIGVAQARDLVRERQAAMPAGGDEVVALRMPGFSLSVKGDEANDSSAVAISAGTGREHFVLNAQEDASGADRAHIRIVGADAAAARDFIEDADGLSAQTKADMRAALGL